MILFLSTNDTLGGAATVTYRLVEALRERSVDARMLVARKDSDAPWVARVTPWLHKAAKTAERAEIFINNGFSMADLWAVSTARFGARVSRHPWVGEADVIVLGWVSQGFVSLGDIRRILASGKRTVWMMHDLWRATGICHLPGSCRRYEEGCGRCPLLNWERRRGDTSRLVWQRKANLLIDTPITYIAVSNSQRDAALRSPLMRHSRIEVLPHAFPVDLYTTKPTETCGAPFLNGLTGKKVIAMGAARLDDPIKDLPAAIDALNRLTDGYPELAAGCEAVFFGALRNPRALDTLRLTHRHAGMLDSAQLRELYARTSVVLSTSKFETMGATLMEGMAAGATIVTFGGDGRNDIVTHGLDGYIADSGDTAAFARYIARALDRPFSRDAQHRSVASRFSSQAVAEKFLAIIGAPQ